MLTLTLDALRRLLALGRRDAQDAPDGGVAPSVSGHKLRRGNLIFRLRAWPQLEESGRTAEIYRMLSVMSSQPVNRDWLESRCRMAPQQLDALLQKLVAEGALEVIDPGRFAGPA
ncbi:MAG TPA: hypothetical protein VF522_14385 [Ramlibacter sp.]|uniref:hypothetical protein n=1 Tax=Ramlibacter sp. TaxID=1917967 RepID=UPI002ED3E076